MMIGQSCFQEIKLAAASTMRRGMRRGMRRRRRRKRRRGRRNNPGKVERLEARFKKVLNWKSVGNAHGIVPPVTHSRPKHFCPGVMTKVLLSAYLCKIFFGAGEKRGT
jgi:hypothetical protein